jgi:hypothetical protein
MKFVSLHQHIRVSLVLATLFVSGPATAQVNIDAYRDYFLVGRFGEVCTMCEVTVLCEAGDVLPEHAAIPGSRTFTVYHLQTRTFWSQVSTIWEWFLSNFSAAPLAARGHTRPVHIYNVKDGDWQPREIVEARLVLDPGVLEFGDKWINRVDRRWIDTATQQPVGFCQRLPLWEALDTLAAMAGEGPGR